MIKILLFLPFIISCSKNNINNEEEIYKNKIKDSEVRIDKLYQELNKEL